MNLAKIVELKKKMSDEIRSYVTSITIGNTKIESVDESKRKEIEDYYLPLIEEAKNEKTTDELRQKEYLAKGLTPDKLIVALWEKVVEGRPEEADKIQAERIAIKQQIPKK